MFQETRVVDQRLGAVQSAARDAGWRGLWAPAEETGGASAASCSSGACVLAPTDVMVTMPPDGDHVVFPHHAAAARVHWGVPGGLIVVSVHMVQGVGVAGPTSRSFGRGRSAWRRGTHAALTGTSGATGTPTARASTLATGQ
eukprot:5955159-Pyramimonas_sp.AAC.1